MDSNEATAIRRSIRLIYDSRKSDCSFLNVFAMLVLALLVFSGILALFKG